MPLPVPTWVNVLPAVTTDAVAFGLMPKPKVVISALVSRPVSNVVFVMLISAVLCHLCALEKKLM